MLCTTTCISQHVATTSTRSCWHAELVLPGERLAEHLPHGLRLMSRKGRLSAVAPSMDSPLARDAIMAHVQPAAGAAPSQLPADVHSQSRLVNGTGTHAWLLIHALHCWYVCLIASK